MEVIKEVSLRNFEFWSGAIANAEMLTADELDEVEKVLECDDTKYTETQINDLFWFDFGYVCELIGLRYDSERDKVIRDDEDDEEDED